MEIEAYQVDHGQTNISEGNCMPSLPRCHSTSAKINVFETAPLGLKRNSHQQIHVRRILEPSVVIVNIQNDFNVI